MSLSQAKRLYLEKIHLVAYKSIEDLHVDFKYDLNIIIGKNGAGKSNLLEAIRGAMSTGLSTQNFPLKHIEANFVTSANETIRLEITKVKRTNLKAEGIDNDGPKVSQNLFVNNELLYSNVPEVSKTNALLYSRNIRRALRNINIQYGNPIYIKYAIPQHIQLLTEAGQIGIPLDEPEMFEIPYDLLVVDNSFVVFENSIINNEVELTSLSKEDLIKLVVADENFINNLKKFTPIQGFKLNENINIYNDGKQVIIENLKFDFLVNNHWMPWSYLSDGTKRLFYLVAQVTAANGKLVLIEEPELGVHPHQFNLLMHFLKEQSQFCQIILSTHAPSALDHLDQDELDHVLIAYSTVDEGTKIKRMAADQKETAIKYMNEVGSLSDYWLMSDLE